MKECGENERTRELAMAREEDTQAARLTEEQGKALLWLARETIARKLGVQAQEPGAEIAARL